MPVSCEVSRPVASFFDFMKNVMERFYTNDGIRSTNYRLILQYQDLNFIENIEIVDFSIPVYKDSYNINDNIHSHNVSSLICLFAFFSMDDFEPRILSHMNSGKPIRCNIDYLHEIYNAANRFGYSTDAAYIFQFIRWKFLDFLAIRFSSEIINKIHVDNNGNAVGSVAHKNDCENEILA